MKNVNQPPVDQHKLIQDNLGYVKAIAAKIKRDVPKVEYEDLVAYGSKGLVEAAHRFDSRRGVAFTTFAYYRIRGAIFDGLRETHWLNRQHGRFTKGANAYLENRAERTVAGRASTSKTLSEIAETLDDVATIFLTSMAGPDEPEDTTTPDGSDVLESKETCEALRAALKSLPEKERRLVEMFYFEGITLQDAGKALNLSKSWASRLHARAIKLLAKQME